MADQDKQPAAQRRISVDDRFRYIGFEVYPGKPGDLFASEAEKAKLVDTVVAKRTRGERLREHCTLMIQRISGAERWLLVVASAVILLSLFLPWFSVYKERVVTPTQTTASAAQKDDERGEVITSVQTRKKVERQVETVSGIGGFAAMGAVFSGSVGLMLTGLIGLLFTLSAIAIPIYMLMSLFRQKSLDDQYALKLKQLLRLNWIPVCLFALALVVSMLGGDYGSSGASAYANLGSSYGPGVFISTISYGLAITVGAFVLLAIKGIEI